MHGKEQANPINPSYSPTLDDLDLMLIRELESDARQSCQDLGDKLEISKATVSRRMQRLLDRGVIDICTIPYAPAMGFRTAATIRLNTLPGRSDEVADRLKSYENIHVIVLLTGRNDIALFTVFRSHSEMIDFVERELASTSGVVRADISVILKWVKMSWSVFDAKPTDFKDAMSRDLDELEMRLIRELESQPRESVAGLARKVGISRSLAKHKLQTLLDEGIIRVVSIVDPEALGLETRAVIDVAVQPGKLYTVANTLSGDSRILQVAITTGPFNLLLWTVFRNWREMSSFLRNELGNIPGVISHETSLEVAIPKYSFSLMA